MGGNTMSTDTHNPDGVKITSEEKKRELEESSAETWHWKEVDLRDWATKRLRHLFSKGKQLVNTQTEKLEVVKAELYGEAFATSRRGKTEVTCNMDCRIYWRGKLLFNDGVVGTANGTFKFPEVVANIPSEEWVLHTLADGEDPSAMRMLNPCGSLEETQLRPLEAYEVVLRDAARSCEGEVRGLMAKLIQDMQAHAAGESVEDVCTDKADPDDSHVSEAVKKEVEAKIEGMRIEALPSKLQEAIKRMEANEGPEKVELSVCRITDKELLEIAAALKNNTTVTHLNLSFNQITDVGVQGFVTQLATGIAKSLKELNLSNNSFGNMGKQMLDGIKFMRKDISIIYKSSIDAIGK